MIQSFHFVGPAVGWGLLVFASLAHADQMASTAPATHREFKVNYRSPIDGYQGFADPALAPWKEANDTVGRIGGWRAYAREARGDVGVKPSTGTERDDPHANHGGSRR